MATLSAARQDLPHDGCGLLPKLVETVKFLVVAKMKVSGVPREELQAMITASLDKQHNFSVSEFIEDHSEDVSITIEAEIPDLPACKRCSSDLKDDGKCSDVTCPYSDRQLTPSRKTNKNQRVG